MAPCAALGGLHARCCPPARHACSQAAFRPQRRAGAPDRRPQSQLIIRAAEADRSKNQDTVGDLSRDQVKAALDRQLKFAASKKGQDGDSNSNEQAPAASTEDEEPAPEPEAPATDEERTASVKALEELKKRVPLMSVDDVQGAIDRLLGQKAGEGGASASGAGENSSTTTTQSSGGGDSGAQPAKPSGGGQKKGKHEPDHTYDDGSVLFTAETLAKVSFDELKP